MVNLDGYKQDHFKGIITEVKEMPLRDYLGTPEKVTAFTDGMTKYPKNVKTEEERKEYRKMRLNSTVLSLTYAVSIEGKESKQTEFFNIPTIRGWGRSKLKSLREKNSLPFDTKEWIGKEVTSTIDKKGYLRLIEEF